MEVDIVANGGIALFKVPLYFWILLQHCNSKLFIPNYTT
jgi:hypothetical protein